MAPSGLSSAHGPCRLYNCYSDEHQLPIVLALAGRQEETDCTGHLSNVDWTPGGPHPRQFGPQEVTAKKMRDLRLPLKCDAAAAVTCAARAPGNRCGSTREWSLSGLTCRPCQCTEGFMHIPGILEVRRTRCGGRGF